MSIRQYPVGICIERDNYGNRDRTEVFVSPDFSTILRAKISETKVLQHSCRELGNTYFDTPDNWLRQHDIGLRIRRFDEVYVQTVKTAGRVVSRSTSASGSMPNITVMSPIFRCILPISGRKEKS